MRDLQLAESEQSLRELQFCTYDGVFIWKIADFARRRQDAVGGRAPAMFSPGKGFLYFMAVLTQAPLLLLGFCPVDNKI